ncbi:MAG: DUF4292 domain-containing protein [Flavobacteriaceae bacterium]
MNIFKYSILIAVFFGLLTSCKTSKTISGNNSNLTLSTKQLIKENTARKAQFKTYQAKLKIGFTKGDKQQTHTVSFRAEKDKVIWMSASFSIVKALITPEKVSFYNKLDNTYFDGDYTYLSNLLGTQLDFNKVQNLLFGETLFSLSEGQYKVSVNQNAYVLEPQKQQRLFEIFYLLDPKLFKVASQQISQPETLRHLQIDYLSYQEVNQQTLPEHIKIIAVEANEEAIIDLEFKNITLNDDLKFPFKIPSGFKAIKL